MPRSAASPPSSTGSKKVATMSRDERLELLDRPPVELPLATQASLLGLNRTHLYYVPQPPSAEELALKRRIDELFTARPYYGVRKITAQLRKDGCLANHKAVARHMCEMGLAAISPGPNLSKRAHAHVVYPYLLRTVTAQRPNHVWGIDIPYITNGASARSLVAVLAELVNTSISETFLSSSSRLLST